MKLPICIKSEQFTIYDDIKKTIPDFKPRLYSVWNVERETEYITYNDGLVGNDFYACFRTLSGKAILKTKNGLYFLKPYDLIFVRYNTIIKYGPAEGKWEYICYNFYADGLSFFELDNVYNIPVTMAEQEENNEMFSVMAFYNEVNVLLTNSIFYQLYIRWIKSYNDKNLLTFPHYSELLDVLKYIDDNITNIESVDELAKRCYLSPRQFRSIFKQMTGETPKTYICKQKLKKTAILLITTTMSINTIAIEMHYSSPFQLSRDFKKQFGISPKQYRERQQ